MTSATQPRTVAQLERDDSAAREHVQTLESELAGIDQPIDQANDWQTEKALRRRAAALPDLIRAAKVEAEAARQTFLAARDAELWRKEAGRLAESSGKSRRSAGSSCYRVSTAWGAPRSSFGKQPLASVN